MFCSGNADRDRAIRIFFGDWFGMRLQLILAIDHESISRSAITSHAGRINHLATHRPHQWQQAELGSIVGRSGQRSSGCC
ncbi:MAG: hypothetical protein EA001_02450 [Oscillatoriales cyanobacterium]|nr:MAG: hypothetical protein EA001_02450 [Oscillatoriales cyanobacterium]